MKLYKIRSKCKGQWDDYLYVLANNLTEVEEKVGWKWKEQNQRFEIGEIEVLAVDDIDTTLKPLIL